MSNYEKAISLAEYLIDNSYEEKLQELNEPIKELAELMEDMKLKDVNSIMKYMKSLILSSVPEDKRDMVSKYLNL